MSEHVQIPADIKLSEKMTIKIVVQIEIFFWYDENVTRCKILMLSGVKY